MDSDTRTRKSQEYAAKAPKAACMCDHTGDGENSEHGAHFQGGHGPCTLCKCSKFRWKHFLPEFEEFMRRAVS